MVLAARIGLLLGSIFLALGIAEGGLRLLWGDEIRSPAELRRQLERSRDADLSRGRGLSLFGLVQASRHADVVYELKPGLDGLFRDQPIRTNSVGLRQDREVSPRKDHDVFRIVGLGDSHMFGWGVAQGETYLEVLEASLNRRLASVEERSTGERQAPRRVEVLNCAAPGYNATMEVAVYEHKCSQYEHDLVIVHLVGNDLGLPHFLQPLSAQGRRPPRSYVLALLRAALASPETEPDLLPHDIRHLPPEERHAIRGSYADRAGPEGLRKAYRRLAELTTEKGVPVVLLMLGSGGPVRQLASAEADELGFEVVDAAPYFAERLAESGGGDGRDAWRAAYVLPGDGHPTALAHRRYAELLERVIRRKW